jgi:2-oxoglutarate dehydrogenase complex dehydrogenase (E1) component-like enzyme
VIRHLVNRNPALAGTARGARETRALPFEFSHAAEMNLKSINFGTIRRQPSASTATGYNKVHQQEQAEIIETAFSI